MGEIEKTEKIEEREYIPAEYTLTEQEVKQALYAAGRLKSHVPTGILQTALGVVGFVLFGMNILSNPSAVLNYIICGLCLFFIAFVWIWPVRIEQKGIRRAVSDTVMSLKVYPDKIKGRIRSESQGWELPLDKSLALSQTEEVLTLHLETGKLLVIPKRAFPEEGKEEAIGRILQGTRPRLKQGKR